MLRRVRAFVLVAAAGLAGACGGPSGEPSPPPTPPTESATNGLTVVDDNSEVCMVNNTYMGKLQIAVEVEGRTYYGCCPACRDRLIGEPSVRTARDPVTGEVVDKAHAVIARNARNGVLYFASAQNVRRHQGAL